MSKFNLVTVKLEGLQKYTSTRKNFVIGALVADSISAPKPMKVRTEWLRQPILRGLDLADEYDEDILEVELIIGK